MKTYKKKSFNPKKTYSGKKGSYWNTVHHRLKKDRLVTKPMLYRAIHKNEETKIVCVEQNYTLYNSGISSNTEMSNVLPPVPNDTTASGRIGDSIRPVKLVIRGVMSYNSYNLLDSQMIISRMFLVQQKGIRDANQKTSVSTSLLQFGATNTTFTGALLDITRPQNTDLFTFFADKKHIFLKPYGINGTTAAGNMTSSDKSLVKYFTITLTQKQLPAVLKYSGSSSTNPSNFLPLLCVGYSYANNGSPDVATTQIGISYTSTLYYKDA